MGKKPILKVRYLVPDLKPLCYSNEGDAGLDLMASGRWGIFLDSSKDGIISEDYIIRPTERILIKTGIEIEIPKGYWGNIRDRSGLAMKHGLHTLAGVIDETYRGEIGVVMVNLGIKEYELRKNDKVAQIIITPYSLVEIVKTEDLSETFRGKRGFGSSG